MDEKITDHIFIEGPIPADLLYRIIQQYSMNHAIGAFSAFIGQVRNDTEGDSKVVSVEFSTQPEMARETFLEIQSDIFARYELTGLNVYHSKGLVKAGEICFLVLTASTHRSAAIRACDETVEKVKSQIPIWGKMFLENGAVVWKENN